MRAHESAVLMITLVSYALHRPLLQLWDLKSNTLLRSWKEHTAEVYSVDWNLVDKERLISGAWDNSIKLYHPEEAGSIGTFTEHTKCIYSTQWHPRNGDMFASTSGDCTVKVWDTNTRRSTLTIHAHDFEVLTCDWNKYNEFLLSTGSVDKSIRTWDIRAPREPLTVMEGHEFAVRRLKCSPHHATAIATAS
jgi:peroxin-7